MRSKTECESVRKSQSIKCPVLADMRVVQHCIARYFRCFSAISAQFEMTVSLFVITFIQAINMFISTIKRPALLLFHT